MPKVRNAQEPGDASFNRSSHSITKVIRHSILTSSFAKMRQALLPDTQTPASETATRLHELRQGRVNDLLSKYNSKYANAARQVPRRARTHTHTHTHISQKATWGAGPTCYSVQMRSFFLADANGGVLRRQACETSRVTVAMVLRDGHITLYDSNYEFIKRQEYTSCLIRTESLHGKALAQSKF